MGRVQDERARALAERGGEFRRVKRPIRGLQADKSRRRAANNGVRAVVLIKRLEDYDFLAGIDDREEGTDHRFRRPAAYCDLLLRVHGHASGFGKLVGDGRAKVPRPPGDGVLVDVPADGGHGCFLHFGWGGKVREPLSQIDRAVFHGQARHFPNNGLGELMRFPRDWQSLVADGCRHGYRMLCPRRSAIKDISRTPDRPPKGRDKRAHRAGRARRKFELPVWE